MLDIDKIDRSFLDIEVITYFSIIILCIAFISRYVVHCFKNTQNEIPDEHNISHEA